MLSVIVSTHDRRALVLRLLEGLAAQDLDRAAFEIVVVADGCTDDTAGALASLELPVRLRVIEQPRRGLAAARNRGAARAVGDALVFLDDDMVPARDFLSALRASLDDGAHVVLPLTRVGDWVPDGLLAREQRAWVEHGVRVMAGGAPTMDDVHFAATAIRRDCFALLGGFDESFTAGGAWGREDAELAYRLLRRGGRVVFRPEIVVDMDCVTNPHVALRRARTLGRGDVYFARKHPEVAPHLFGAARRDARIQRVVGAVVLRAPRATALLWPLRRLVAAAAERGRAGGLLYRLWLTLWAAEWWRGVADAGGRELARRALHR